jgi:gluconate 5-dehydrogenase
MENGLTGMNVVITGGSSGFGLNMGTTLLKAGANVALAARDSDKFSQAIEDLKKEGLSPLKLIMDVRDEGSIQNAAKIVISAFGSIDMLVNNAGIGNNRINPGTMAPIPFWQIKQDAFRDMVDTNFTGVFLVTKEFVPNMIQKGKGRIVNISTALPVMRMPGMIPYGPTKAAMDAFSDSIAEELAPHHITVNILEPGGAAKTGFLPIGPEDTFFENFDLLEADILNKAILFLASPRAEQINKERIIAKEFNAWLSSHGLHLSPLEK